MNIDEIVAAIDAEIEQLLKVKALLNGTTFTTKRRPGRPSRATVINQTAAFNSVKPAKKNARRSMSAEGRAKIAAAQKARWEKSRRAAKKALRKAVSDSTKKQGTAKATSRNTTQVKKARAVKKPAQPKAEAAATSSS
jgi:hypothetical protein